MIVVVFAHPYPDRSRANRALRAAIEDLDGVTIRSLYDLYPDFAIDVEAEKTALERASVIVLQHPIYWYSPPALLKLWFEKVLTVGWAYGPGGDALAGKRCWWVVSTGTAAAGYTPSTVHEHTFDEFELPVRQTARFCGMTWLPPLVVHGAHEIDDADLAAAAARYRADLRALAVEDGRSVA
jgi:glutathione-regulated potassium-efflux system ancillary protein KefF